MKAHKLCGGLTVPEKFKVGTYRELEKYFELPVAQWAKIKPGKTDNIDAMMEVCLIIAKQENEQIKTIDDLEASIDDSENSVVEVYGTFMVAMNGGEVEPGKKK